MYATSLMVIHDGAVSSRPALPHSDFSSTGRSAFSDGGNADPTESSTALFTVTTTQNRLSADGTRLVRLPGASDLPVVADRAGMQRQEGIALDVGGNGLRRGGIRLHHLLLILEHRSHCVIDQVVRQLRLRDREVE